MTTPTKARRTRGYKALLVLSLGGLAAAATLLLPSGGAARATAAPVNTSEPRILGTPIVGRTLSATTGAWSGTTPISFSYRWLRCPSDGGKPDGSNCSVLGDPRSTYVVRNADVGLRLRVRVIARNSSGVGRATSNPTDVVSTARPPTGCPAGPSADVSQISPPARLVIDQIQFLPSPVTRSTKTVQGRFHISDTCGQSVKDALVYATAVPFNQLSVQEIASGADGWATIDFQVLSGFPAAHQQQLLVVFVRARKPGEPLLAGISNRRLVSVPVKL